MTEHIAFDGPGCTVIDGPFSEIRELVAGFWLFDIKDMDEAVAWVNDEKARLNRAFFTSERTCPQARYRAY
ncbi:YciI family protein [Pseudomonas fluorescens]|uniref:YciI family protein n=1 Tax=Pseudomonas fluorescens TaxID=294 RepID=UPI003D02A2E9